MENPVRRQLNDFIGRRQITHPQFIRADNMDAYFSAIGVDSQREIVLGLLRCSDLSRISDEVRNKIVHLYNNLYILKEPLKKRQTLVVVTRDGKQRKSAIIHLLDENQRLMHEIVDHLSTNKEETAQAIINWTISTVNLFGGAYLSYRCEIDQLKKVREQSVHLAEQIADILSGTIQKLEADKPPASAGLFASKEKNKARQLVEEQIGAAGKVIENLGKSGKLVDGLREPIFLAHRVARALQANAEKVQQEWKSFFESRIRDEKGLPVVAVTPDHTLKAASEKQYEPYFATVIREMSEHLESFRQLLPDGREILKACGITGEETCSRVVQASRSLNTILNNLLMELRFACQNTLNRKQQIIRDRITYTEEKLRTEEVLLSAFARTLEEIFPADFRNSKAALNEMLHQGITRDQYSLLRSEINFWSAMKDRIFEQGKESRKTMFIRRRRMINEILPDEIYYIEYSDKLRKTIDIATEEKPGFEPFIQQDFHDLLKYLVSLYRSGEAHIRLEETEAPPEPGRAETT